MNKIEDINLEQFARDVFSQPGLIEAQLRGARKNTPDSLLKVDVRPVVVRGETRFQFAFQRGQKQTHENLTSTDAPLRLTALLTESFRQVTFRTAEADWEVSLNKHREPQLRKHPPTRTPMPEADHDRRKNHLLNDNALPPFLTRLGLATQDSKPIASRRDKLKQINRFLELVADVLDVSKEETETALETKALRVVDFGCGKGYLTFALYHYLTVTRGITGVEIIGIDLKADVIEEVNAIARDSGYTGLKFRVGSIADFTEWTQADAVIALHACDTATDDALLKALALDAKLIFAAPCCQHELSRQLDNELMHPLLKHGILRERLSALITDAARAELLTAQGYAVQIVEFIDAEHTPKNLLIRAVRKHAKRQTEDEEWTQFRDFWHIHPALERGLKTEPGA